jgi:non-ribosomal peptide synthetase component E (peptide arylation enzyme)
MLNNETIASLFSKQTQNTPDYIALAFQNDQLTYKKLDERSNQLANFLRERGVGNKTLVPICLDRSFEMIIGILGLIKAGGLTICTRCGPSLVVRIKAATSMKTAPNKAVTGIVGASMQMLHALYSLTVRVWLC